MFDQAYIVTILLSPGGLKDYFTFLFAHILSKFYHLFLNKVAPLFFLFAHFLDSIMTKRKSPEDNQERDVEAGI